VNLHHRLYEFSLALYPRDLRRGFGPEMADIFALQLADARAKRSPIAAVRVLWDAYAELLTIALPGSAVSPALPVPLASLVATTVMYASLSWALENPLRLRSIYHALVAAVNQ